MPDRNDGNLDHSNTYLDGSVRNIESIPTELEIERSKFLLEYLFGLGLISNDKKEELILSLNQSLSALEDPSLLIGWRLISLSEVDLHSPVSKTQLQQNIITQPQYPHIRNLAICIREPGQGTAIYFFVQDPNDVLSQHADFFLNFLIPNHFDVQQVGGMMSGYYHRVLISNLQPAFLHFHIPEIQFKLFNTDSRSSYIENLAVFKTPHNGIYFDTNSQQYFEKGKTEGLPFQRGPLIVTTENIRGGFRMYLLIPDILS